MSTGERQRALHENAYKYLIFIALAFSIASFFVPRGEIEAATVMDTLVILVSLTIGAASLFFIIFAFSIYQEMKQVEKLFAKIEHNEREYRRMCDTVIKEYEDFRKTDRRRWKMVSISMLQSFTDIARRINDKETKRSIDEELLKLEPLRYLLISVTKENVPDTVKALQECVALAANPNTAFPADMYEILIEAVDAQTKYVAAMDIEVAGPLLERLSSIRRMAVDAEEAQYGSADPAPA